MSGEIIIVRQRPPIWRAERKQNTGAHTVAENEEETPDRSEETRRRRRRGRRRRIAAGRASFVGVRKSGGRRDDDPLFLIPVSGTRTMAPAGSTCKEVHEPYTAVADYSVVISKQETNSTPAKSSIVSLGQRGIRSNAGVDALLECPVCTNLMYSPIYQCLNGHTLCSTCKIRVHNVCPICRSELGDIRCLALEKVAESLELPCRYKNLGCHEIFQYFSKPGHEQQCQFRPYNCPYAGSECSITGNIPTLVAHLGEDHKVDMHNGCSFQHRYVKSNPQEVENATWMLTVFDCFGRQFCLHFEAFQLGMAPVYMAFLRFMGEETEARKFSYSLEVGGNGRKLTWELKLRVAGRIWKEE
ncbi:hypothetical protein NL676_016777 [Syzygium grande]|nr:hypothetical protein NL676_016777 [Syzygium grande]